ncbi:MAG TPA: YihY/virulence factor BrkB family protein [Myxococcaceae bacterium]|nr:YihY/virulence factor BrkB family protein [Myxococcaceae bacterium]
MVLPGKGMGWKKFFVTLKNEWTKDNVGDVAGALTFSGIFALFPFLLFVVSLAGLVIDPQQIQAIIEQLGEVAPPQVTQIVGDRIRSLAKGQSAGLVTFSALAAIWAASGGIVALMRALNTVYGVEEDRPFWKVRGVAILGTLVTALVALLATLAAVVTPVVADAIGGPVGTAVIWLRLPLAGAMMLLLWALLYYFLPNAEQKFSLITPGSLVGVGVWVAASWGFSVYVSNFGKYEATYGALGGVAVLLLWMWISAQVLLLGAEINAIIEHSSPEGKSAGARSLSEPGPDAPKSEAGVRSQRNGRPAAKGGEAQRLLEALEQARRHPNPDKPRKTAPSLLGWAFGLGVLASRRRTSR